MKKNLLLLLCCIGVMFTASPLRAQDNIHAMSHVTGASPEQVMQLKEQMNRMATEWVNLEVLLASNPIDYKAVPDVLNRMQQSAKAIRKINHNQQLDAQLKNLLAVMDTMKRDAKRKAPDELRKNLDALSNTCFGCHATHALPD